MWWLLASAFIDLGQEDLVARRDVKAFVFLPKRSIALLVPWVVLLIVEFLVDGGHAYLVDADFVDEVALLSPVAVELLLLLFWRPVSGYWANATCVFVFPPIPQLLLLGANIVAILPSFNRSAPLFFWRLMRRWWWWWRWLWHLALHLSSRLSIVDYACFFHDQ